ncbi:MAG: hypothetical protein WC742_15485 [Gallionellaceae bacterium]|jgi:hypothetical protein
MLRGVDASNESGVCGNFLDVQDVVAGVVCGGVAVLFEDVLDFFKRVFLVLWHPILYLDIKPV